MPSLQRYSPTKLCDGAKMAIFGDFFVSCISRELRAACFRPASEIRTKAIPCVEVWQTSNLRPPGLGEGKKKKEKQHETRMWVNAQPDGRPAEHRWRPLFNAEKFG